MQYDIPYVWDLKMIQMNLLTKQKVAYRLREGTYVCSGLGEGRRRGSYGVLDGHVHTAIYKMHNQQEPMKE